MKCSGENASQSTPKCFFPSFQINQEIVLSSIDLYFVAWETAARMLSIAPAITLRSSSLVFAP